jgi:hypothetical protein
VATSRSSEEAQAPEGMVLTPLSQAKAKGPTSAIRSPLRATSTPPPATPDPPQQSSTSHPEKQILPKPAPPRSPVAVVKANAIPMLQLKRRVTILLKKEPSKYNEAEITRTLSIAFGGNSPYTRIERRHLAGTLAIVARGMRKKKVLDKLIQARAGLDTN